MQMVRGGSADGGAETYVGGPPEQPSFGVQMEERTCTNCRRYMPVSDFPGAPLHSESLPLTFLQQARGLRATRVL